jgi:hypothetical protein
VAERDTGRVVGPDAAVVRAAMQQFVSHRAGDLAKVRPGRTDKAG